jgi:large subunit ribosomal protein L22
MLASLTRRFFATSTALQGDIVSAALRNVSVPSSGSAASTVPSTPKEAVSLQQSLRISSIKLRWLANSVRGLSYSSAVAQMKMSPRRKAADMIEFGLHSARGNAVNQRGLQLERLFVHRIEVNKGHMDKRQNFHSKGRTGRMTRPHAHLRITLAERAPPVAAAAEPVRQQQPQQQQ